MPAETKKKEKGDLLWFRTVLFVVPMLITTYFRLVDLTSRKVFLNREYEDEVCKKRPFAFACFHGTMLFPGYYCRRYPAVLMVSRSWDGELIDRSVRLLKYETTRGSSSRGGKEALQEMIDLIKEKNYSSGQAVDGPRGPAKVVKMGIVVVARETGQPVVPVVTWATRQLQFKSWDKMVVPLPFSPIVTAFGKPMMVPQDLEREDYERIRQEIEDEMHRVLQQTEEKVENIKQNRILSRFFRKRSKQR